ncbi:MAG TPA: alpha-ketoacid dehydrogenase subunit beta [Candidatus Acidoferrales bacterium]|nr:alpha-ketoacid dehydrogenase subunit beta [Candidatus Acidoferrales bacterium]
MSEINLVTAINLALARAMSEDQNVVVLGEDVGIDGGVFRATDGLVKRFGEDRVRDTPISEATIAGLSIGLALEGFKPVAEIQFSGFAYPCIDQIANHGARFRTRTRGRLSCPMVLRTPWAGGVKALEHHSEANETMFTNVPGLRVVIPSSPKKAYGLLLAAIRDPDPVIFFEPTRLYRAAVEEVADNGVAAPLDTCFVVRQGKDLTLVAWGAMIPQALQTADALAAKGVSAEVIDVATLRPLDEDTILDSVRRTGRCVIVQEAGRTGGFAGEIAARVAEKAFSSLLAPVERVTGYDVVLPLPRLEEKFLPNTERIGAAAQRAMAYA